MLSRKTRYGVWWPCVVPLLVLLVLCQTQYAWGQAALGQQIRTNINRSRSPTDFLSRVRARSIYLRLAGDAQLLSTQFSGQYALSPSLALRLLVPLVHVDPDVAGMSPRFGLGDMRTRTLWRVWHTPLTAAVIGVELFFPTATDPLLGTEKYSIAPIAAFLYQIRKVFVIPVYQQLVSYAGNNDRADINIVRFRQIILAQWPKRWWTTFDVGFLWDLEDDLLTEDTMTLGIEVGKQLSSRFAISAKPSFRVYGSADSVLAFELAFSYNLE